MKRTIIITSALLLQACAHTMPMPTGKSRPVNSIERIEKMAYDNNQVITGDAEPAVKELLLRRPMTRAKDPRTFIEIGGSRLIDRVVPIEFEYGSVQVKPTAQQLVDMMELGVEADRVLIRAQNSARDGNPIDAQMARKRAEEVRYYLVHRRGIPEDIITLSYEPHGGYLPDDQVGRDSPRRVVDVKYIFDRLES